MKVLLGIQARTESKRLPRKIYKDIGGKPMLQWVWEAVEKAPIEPPYTEKIVRVLAPENDEELVKWCDDRQYSYILGDPLDLLNRYVTAADEVKADRVVRITSDCVFHDPTVIAACMKVGAEVDYCSNTIVRSYPEGLDVQCCSKEALSWFSNWQKEQREHPFIDFDQNSIIRDSFVRDGFTWKQLLNLDNPIFQHTSIDTPEDLERARENASS